MRKPVEPSAIFKGYQAADQPTQATTIPLAATSPHTIRSRACTKGGNFCYVQCLDTNANNTHRSFVIKIFTLPRIRFDYMKKEATFFFVCNVLTPPPIAPAHVS